MSSNTSCTLTIAGRNSGDTYTLNVPSNLLNFCRYDFTRFLEECSRLCRECMKSGEYPIDKIVALRKSIGGCHKYVENNLKTVFEKIVVDCWIEYICRQGEITVSELWGGLIGCTDPFQISIFQRLTEYRTHRAINQWINILKIQEYAKKKIDFVFGCKLNSPAEAVSRLNFFDLMFSVAANEQGYSLENIGSVRMCKPGRTAGAPFIYGGISKEIVKNLFKEVQFADSQPYVSREEGAMSDWEAMDAFAVIKNYLPSHTDSVAKIIQKSLTKTPENIFSPSCFKAMIDLEIDTIVNMGGYLQKCAKCGEFFLKNEHYTSDYCDTVRRDGSTCRELMEAEGAEPLDETALLLFNEKAEKLYHKMAEKVNVEISQRDFAEWSGNFDVMRNNVIKGKATDSDFDDFVEYSEQLANQNMSKAKQNVLAAHEEMTRPDGTKAQVKPYTFARVDRRELEKQGMLKPADQQEKLPPISDKKKAEEKPAPAVARIIRGANPTSYHEIPVQNTRQPSEAVIPIKSDVFVGEDFSNPPQNAADQSRKTASSSRDIILQMAEQERIRRQNEEGGQNAQSHSQSEKARDNRPRLPDLDEYPVDDSFTQDTFVGNAHGKNVSNNVPDNASHNSHFEENALKDSSARDELAGAASAKDSFVEDTFAEDTFVEAFPVKSSGASYQAGKPAEKISEKYSESNFEKYSESNSENRVNNSEKYPERFAAENYQTEKSAAHLYSEQREDLFADGYSSASDSGDFGEAAESGFGAENIGNKHKEAGYRTEKTEKAVSENNGRKNDDNYHTKSEQVRQQWEQRSDVEFHAREPAKRQPPRVKLPEFEEDKKDKDNFVTLVSSKERTEHIEEIDLLKKEEEKTERPNPDRTPKSPASRAAKVAGAYRSVAQMPAFEKREKEGVEESGSADDFAKILSNIERNDGFDEESLPLDADGMPLSHKTKHVMDALMRNSSVSPSLIFGRRQAAEKNVIIDEDYIEKNGKKSGNNKKSDDNANS